MIRVLVWTVLFVAALFLLRGLFAPKARRASDAGRDGAGDGALDGGTLVRDPVCGTFVAPDRALTVDGRDGRHHFFCSERCAERFRITERAS